MRTTIEGLTLRELLGVVDQFEVEFRRHGNLPIFFFDEEQQLHALLSGELDDPLDLDQQVYPAKGGMRFEDAVRQRESDLIEANRLIGLGPDAVTAEIQPRLGLAEHEAIEVNRYLRAHWPIDINKEENVLNTYATRPLTLRQLSEIVGTLEGELAEARLFPLHFYLANGERAAICQEYTEEAEALREQENTASTTDPNELLDQPVYVVQDFDTPFEEAKVITQSLAKQAAEVAEGGIGAVRDSIAAIIGSGLTDRIIEKAGTETLVPSMFATEPEGVWLPVEVEVEEPDPRVTPIIGQRILWLGQLCRVVAIGGNVWPKDEIMPEGYVYILYEDTSSVSLLTTNKGGEYEPTWAQLVAEGDVQLLDC